MEKPITYCLLDQDKKSSATYYKSTQVLARLVNQYVKENAQDIIKEYMSYLTREKVELLRTQSEYGLEYLTLGILLQSYGTRSQKVKKSHIKQIIHLSKRKEANKKAKRTTAYLKGKLIMRYLWMADEKIAKSAIKYTTNDIAHLLMYLEASGEYTEAVKRLTSWKDFLLEIDYAEKVIEKSLELAIIFNRICDKNLNTYVPGVDLFLKEGVKAHLGKDDLFLAQQGKIEYYLNMVGAEIFNQAMRNLFLRAKKKYVFVPVCMIYQPLARCQRTSCHLGYRCQGCTDACMVNQIRKMAIKYDAQVIIIDHESDFNEMKIKDIQDGVGIIGIACVLNLLSGGWKARRLDLMPQCVILDYCGCKKHWDKVGFMTQIDLKQLEEIFTME